MCTKVSLLSACLTAPREGHLAAVLHAMSYMGQKHNTRLTFDPTYPEIDYEVFNYDKPWVNFYGNVNKSQCLAMCLNRAGRPSTCELCGKMIQSLRQILYDNGCVGNC